MLPFLKKKQEGVATGVIIKHRAPDEKPEENQEDGEMDHDQAILACAKDLIEGVNSNNAHKVADAFRSAFEILEMMPHDEVDHEEDNSFAGRNAAAAKESQE